MGDHWKLNSISGLFLPFCDILIFTPGNGFAIVGGIIGGLIFITLLTLCIVLGCVFCGVRYIINQTQ